MLHTFDVTKWMSRITKHSHCAQSVPCSLIWRRKDLTLPEFSAVIITRLIKPAIHTILLPGITPHGLCKTSQDQLIIRQSFHMFDKHQIGSHLPIVDQQVMNKPSLIARFMGPTRGSPGADRTQVDPMLATWTLVSGIDWDSCVWVLKSMQKSAGHNKYQVWL